MDSVILGVGTATPPERLTQDQFSKYLPFTSDVAKRILMRDYIESRYLVLPNHASEMHESVKQLTEKHKSTALVVGSKAIQSALEASKTSPTSVGLLCCVTSTGFMCPSLSAELTPLCAFPQTCHRLDLVGLGCSGAVNGLNAVWSWLGRNPHSTAVLLSCEINSAMYATAPTVRNWLVNCLFGDGAGAIVVGSVDSASNQRGPRILGFQSLLIPNYVNAMYFEWDELEERWRFHLSHDVAEVIGKNIAIPITQILERFQLSRNDVRHWIVHSGGPAIVENVSTALNLTEHHLRHTKSVLREYGNLSSSSIIFSLQRLISEDIAFPGDHGLIIAMGPGTAIEVALIRW